MSFSATRTKLLTLLAIVMITTLMITPAVASTTGIISGTVVDSVTGAKLSGVNIIVKGTNLTTVTDARGYFVITNVPPGTYKVQASLVGYGDAFRSDVQVMMDATSPADINLSKVEIDEKEAVVTGKKTLLQPDMAPTLYMVPARQEKMAKTQPNTLYQIPGIVGTQPGITIDGSGSPHIRGGRNDEIGYMLEGIPVTEPLTNAFGTNTVTIGMSKMQIYTGGYRAEYGNAISGVFNEIKKTGSEMPGGRLEMTNGAQNYKGSYFEYGGVSPEGLDYYVGSYLWRTDFEKMLYSGCESSDNIGKFVYPNGKDKWTLLVNQGSAKYTLPTIHDTTYLRQPVTPENDHGHQGYGITSLTWSRNFSSSSFITVRPYTYDTRAVLDALAPDSPMGTYLDYGTAQRGLQVEYTNQLSEGNLLKTGASVISSKNRYMAWMPDLGEMLGHAEWGDYHYNSDVKTTQTGIFIQDQTKLSDKWHTELGLRYDGMKFNKVSNPDTDESQVSPRLGLTYKLDSKNVLKTSWGRFIQFPPSYVMERNYINSGWNDYRLGNLDLKPERSTSWDISWERQLNQNMLMRITPYYRTYTNLLQSQAINPNDPTSMAKMYVNSGDGKSTGVEYYVSKKMSDNWEGWLSYTWQRARANASSLTSSIDPSVWTYCDWDQRHTLNVVLAYKHNNWEHNWQLNYGSGLADSVTASTSQYQGYASGRAVVSWNIIRKLPENSNIGDQVSLNIWNIFNTGKVTQYYVYPDGSKEASSWTTPRFLSLCVDKKF
ncbi:MAG: TonB-dependent receptor [Armatimonadota bacterium]